MTDTAKQASTDQFWQGAAFTPGGTLVVSYYDRSYGTDNTTGYSDITVSASHDQVTFAHERVTSSSMPPPTQFAGQFMGDYAGIDVTATDRLPDLVRHPDRGRVPLPGHRNAGQCRPPCAQGRRPTRQSPTIRTSSPQECPSPNLPVNVGAPPVPAAPPRPHPSAPAQDAAGFGSGPPPVPAGGSTLTVTMNSRCGSAHIGVACRQG